MLPSIAVLWSFALVVAVLTVTPGLDTALVLRSAALGGAAVRGVSSRASRPARWRGVSSRQRE